MLKLSGLLIVTLYNLSLSLNVFAQEQENVSEPPSQLIVLFLLFGVMWFFLIRPQMKKNKELNNMIDSLKKGDLVITSGGFSGIIKKYTEGEQFFEVEISPSVTVNVLRTSVIDKINKDHKEYKKLSKIKSENVSGQKDTKKKSGKNKKAA